MKKIILFGSLLIGSNAMSQMITAGSAVVDPGNCGCYDMTPAAGYQVGSAWSPDSIDLTQDFDMTFQVFVGTDGAWGADGMAFVLQKNNYGIGDIGHSLGVEAPVVNSNPISPQRIAIEIDTYQNTADIPSEPAQDHMGISSGPVVDHDMAGPIQFAAPVSDNTFHEFRVVWDAGLQVLAAYWDGGAFPFIATTPTDIVNTVFGGDSIVYWGFTAATALLYNAHVVCVNSSTLSITADQTTVCPGIPINFDETSSSELGYIYHYEWDFGDGSPVDSTADATYAYTNPGNYTATLNMTDPIGCTYTETINITILDSLTLTMNSSDVSCFGVDDGMGEVVTASGQAPHIYQWNDPGTQTTQQATGLGAGTYTVVVTDDLGCVGIDSVTITAPTQIVLVMDSTMNDCYGGTAGSATVTASNGTPPLTYSWNDASSQSTATASNLAAGLYTVTVTDNNGCQSLASVTITQNTEIVGTVVITDDTGGGVGEIDLTVTGGISPYTFDWSSGESTEDISNLTGGTYQVIITDGLGCDDTVSAEVISDFEVELPTAMSPNGDNLNDTYFIKGIIAYPDNSLIITNRWGNVVYKTEDYDNTWDGVNMKGENLPEGTYYAVFETESGEIHNSFFELRRQ